jgi:hypothetical protein
MMIVGVAYKSLWLIGGGLAVYLITLFGDAVKARG